MKICTAVPLHRIKMFVLWHVIWQLRLLRLQFVPPLALAALLVVSAAVEIIKASPVSHKESFESRDQQRPSLPSVETLADYKSQPLTIGEPKSATTPITVQLPSASPSSSVTQHSPQHFEPKNDSGRTLSGSRQHPSPNQRSKRGTYDLKDYLREFGSRGQLEYSPGLSEPEDQKHFRQLLNSECLQR